LDNIPGIGPKKKSELLDKYPTISKIENASINKIAKLYGFNHELAIKIKNTISEWRKTQTQIAITLKKL
jgi:excinuclease UvrABC nuclease subunit